MSILSTFVLYIFAKQQLENNGKYLKVFKAIAKTLHIEKKGFWYTVQRMIDKI